MTGAAAELLEACEALLEFVRSDRDGLVESSVTAYLDDELQVPDRSTLDEDALSIIEPYDSVIAQAEAAIAKAKGES